VNLKQTVYFMTLVGAVAGLVCWVLVAFLSDIIDVPQRWMVVAIYASLMGALISGLTVAFADKWTSDKIVPNWVAVGALLGLMAGLLTGVLNLVAGARLEAATSAKTQTIAVWVIAGGLIGLAAGMRWASVNALRAFHSLIGGLFGGGLGGLVFAQLGSQPFAQAFAYMLIGSGITLGVTLAPVLLSDGVLQFISSGDPRAQNKYGSPRQEWVVQDGDHLVIGSQGAGMTATVYTQDVHIYIPDAMVGPKHAVLFAKNKRFYLQLHQDNAGPLGQPLEPLQLGNDNVTGTREVRDGDEIIVGQTLLRFSTRRKQADYGAEAGGRR
jgi:MFS family permease